MACGKAVLLRHVKLALHDVREHKRGVNLSPEAADEGSVKGFLRQAVARGRALEAGVKDTEFVSKLLAHVHPGNVLERAADIAASPVVVAVLNLGLRTVRETLPGPSELARCLREGGEQLHVLLPHLAASARRDVRAVAFLAANGIEKVPAESLLAALDGWLSETPHPPMVVNQVLGLLTIVGLLGRFPVGDPETSNRAALELWRIARAGEDEQDVEDAWDTAILCEAALEEGQPIPFAPMRAVG